MIIAWLILCVVVAILASASCGRSGLGWFLISLFFSPLLALLFLAVAGKKAQVQNQCTNTP